jgi:hypothetical protein
MNSLGAARLFWAGNGDGSRDERPCSTFSNASSNHPGGVNVLFGEGSVRFVKDTISPQSWMAIGTRSHGEVVSSDQY